jgi:hypothetical protein
MARATETAVTVARVRTKAGEPTGVDEKWGEKDLRNTLQRGPENTDC